MADVIQKAIEKLRTLHTVKVLRTKTSAYDYSKNSIQDRIDVEIKIGSFTIPCQIILDNSSNYEFPADIVFHKLPNKLKEQSTWLPTHWDIRQEDCLYVWLKELSEYFKKVLVQPGSSIPKRRETEDVDDDYQGAAEKKRRLIEKSDDDSKANRKKFMLSWLSKFPDLYLTFEPDDTTWNYLMKKKASALSKASFSTKVAKAKRVAPVVLKFRMEELFPKEGLHITLISIANTATPGSSIPDTERLKCKVTQEMMDNPTCIITLLAKKAIKFHLADGVYI